MLERFKGHLAPPAPVAAVMIRCTRLRGGLLKQVLEVEDPV